MTDNFLDVTYGEYFAAHLTDGCSGKECLANLMVHVGACVCACERESEERKREREFVFVCVSVKGKESVCERESRCVCVRERESMCEKQIV